MQTGSGGSGKMYVKALRLSGFKSFAQPTVLDFEPGVNIIVGPNGSGKSNLADALAWVLGSQAPSALRGASMEDVIFAGSPGHPRLGMASVELTLDNAGGDVPMAASEVTIARFTDRSGATEYRINGVPCRLLDITELLSDAGVGRSIHTVVGQGQLETVLHARAEDRRTLIEDAAQIGKFRRRKDRAERKIERVEDNLMRLNDVLVELRRALRPLKRQARAAALYSDLMSRHRQLKQQLVGAELRALAGVRRGLDPGAEAHRTSLLSDELASLRARLEGATGERRRLADAASRIRQTAFGIRRAADRFAGLERLARERAARIEARLQAETEQTYRERIRLLEADARRWESECAALDQAAMQLRARAQEAADAADTAHTEARDAEAAVVAARADETKAAQALVRAEGAEAAGRATVGSIEARVDAVLERRAAAAQDLTRQKEVLAAAHAEVSALEEELDTVTRRASEADEALNAARTREGLVKDRLGSSHADLAAASARAGAFQDALEALAAFPAAREVLGPLHSDAAERARLAEASEHEARAAHDSAVADVRRLAARAAEHDEELHRLDALAAAAGDRLAGAARRLQAREVELAALDEELARIRSSLADARRSAAEDRAALPARRAAQEQASAARANAEDAAARARRVAADRRDAATTAEIEARTAHERALGARLRFEEATAGIADAQRALEGLAGLRDRLREQQVRATRVAGLAAETAAYGEQWAEESSERAARADEEAEGAERRTASMRRREQDLSARLEEAARARAEIELRRAEAHARAEAVAERAMEEWGLGSDALVALEAPADGDLDAARAEVARFERDMKRVGAINPHAHKEYEELAEREKFLEGQIEDLRNSRRDLLKIVRDVDAIIVDAFATAYEAIAAEFRGVFTVLFPGGEGRLRLTDPEDMLTTGVDIEARPAGKTVRKMSLLSGGERSLVALAFLFAAFRARPSPFYLLDEVEAALDDVNLHRFVGLVRELAEQAQVLIVTHQKRTMEAADVLYGVSMGRDGVSRVVAKRMEDVATA